MKTILETLRYIFPLILANKIYFFLILNQRQKISHDLDKLFKNNSVSKILKIKQSVQSFWVLNYEEIQLHNYIHTSRNKNTINSEINFILNKIIFFKKAGLCEIKKRKN